MKTRELFVAGAVALALGGCMSGGPSTSPIARAPTGVEGRWIDSNGIQSSFNGGVFESRTTDEKNQKLAQGSYTMAGANTVNISVVSLVRNTTSSVDCILATPSQLNCTNSSGQQFVLTRRA